MIVAILYIYVNGFAIPVGAHETTDVCWLIANRLKQEEIVADCRVETIPSKYAPETSKFPPQRPQRP